MSGYDKVLPNTIISILHLPGEILQHIFLFLDAKSLSSCCLTCHFWSDLISESECIWRLQCLSLKDSIKHIRTDRKQGFSWKETFQRNYGCNGVKRQWKQGKYSNPRSYQELPDRVFCQLDAESWGQVFQWELERS